MTFENSKRLYEHFLKIGKKEAAEELAAKHGFKKEEPKVEEEEPMEPKEEKSKKSK